MTRSLYQRFLVIALGLLTLVSVVSAQSTQEILSTAWSPNGQYIVVGGTNGLVRVNHANGTPYLTLSGHAAGSAVISVGWSPDSTRVLSTGTDFTVRVWNVSQAGHQPGELLSTMTQHIDYVDDAAWSPNGQLIVSVSSGSFTSEPANIKIWSGSDYSFIREGAGANIYNIAWSPDSTKIAMASYAGLAVYDVATLGNSYKQQIFFQYYAYSVDWHGNKLALGATNGDGPSTGIYIYDVATTPYLQLKILPTEAIDGVTWSPDGKSIAGASNNDIQVWDWANGALLESFPTTKKSLTTNIGWKPDSSQLAYGDTGTTPDIAIPPPAYTCTANGIATEASLKAAIVTANAASTSSVICLQPNTAIIMTTLAAPNNTSVGDTFLPVIQKDITIIGNGSTLSRTGTLHGRFFYITGATSKLTLAGLTLTGGIASGSTLGGAVRVDNGTLVIKNSTLTANKGQLGGAIYNNLGTVQIDASTVSSNSAADGGGAIYGVGTFNLTNTTVTQNSSTNNGGALHITNASSVLSHITLTNVNLTSNTTTLYGGGLYFSGGGTLTINGGQIKSNSAVNYGGGIYLNGGATTVNAANTLFEANLATNLQGRGGAIYSTGASIALNLTGSTFTNNTATVQGGAIYNLNADVSVTDGHFTGNHTTGSASDTNGGAIFTNSSSASLTVDDVVFTSNAAGGKGGAIYQGGGTSLMTDSCLTQNTAPAGAQVWNNNSTANSFIANGNWWAVMPPQVNSLVTVSTTLATCPLS